MKTKTNQNNQRPKDQNTFAVDVAADAQSNCMQTKTNATRKHF